jgi:hypothetical protein
MTDLIKQYYNSTKKEQKRIAREYDIWVSQLPCCISGSLNTSKPHHHRNNKYCGTGMKPPDIFEVPITYELHTEVHTTGVKTFEKKYNIDFNEIIIKLHREYMHELVGNLHG